MIDNFYRENSVIEEDTTIQVRVLKFIANCHNKGRVGWFWITLIQIFWLWVQYKNELTQYIEVHRNAEFSVEFRQYHNLKTNTCAQVRVFFFFIQQTIFRFMYRMCIVTSIPEHQCVP